ncbi:MAG: sulfurtransferase [Betaproteobacteria bacterium]|nr:sulfurtransferase [Betaproteobacteria bacterium]
MAAPRHGALVDPAWLAERGNDPGVKLIEIAGMGQDEMQAYRAGHVPGAVCWKWKEMLWDERMRDFPAPADFARRLGAAGIDNDTSVVLYGEGVQFGVYAWWTFRYCGHDKVFVLDGARARWANEGRGLVTDVPPAAKPVEYRQVARREPMRIGYLEVLARLGKPEPVLLDGRTPEEYRGERVNGPGSPDYGALRYGRIPGAKHLYFEELLNEDRSFKPVADLRRLVEARGATTDKELITYCRMSHRASLLYFALTELLGYKKVRMYDGSWTEWGNLVGVPVER